LPSVSLSWRLEEVVIYYLQVGFLWPGIQHLVLHLIRILSSHMAYSSLWTFIGTQFTEYQQDQP
jgi:hypothetical protein